MSAYDDREVDVSSTSNPRVRSLVELRKRRVRDERHVTVLEGHAELALALESGVVPREVYYAPALVREPLPLNALEDLELRQPALVLVCEAIEKPGNLGAMLRTSEAVGVDAVVAASPVADW